MALEACVMAELDGVRGKPLRVQNMEQALRLDPLITYVQDLLKSKINSDLETSDADTDCELPSKVTADREGNKIYNGVVTTKTERRMDKARLYNFSKIKKSRKWLKNLLISDSSSEDEEDINSEEYLQEMLRMHKRQKKFQNHYYKDREMLQYRYYSVGLISNYDKFYEHQKLIVGPKKKLAKEQKKLEKKMKAKLKKLKAKAKAETSEFPDCRPGMELSMPVQKAPKVKKLTPEQLAIKRRKIWISIAKKEIPKAQKQKTSARKEMLSSLKKLAVSCQKECRRAAMQSQRIMKETPMRARRLSKEMMAYWKRFEKVEKEHRKRAAKEAQEQRKMDQELREMKRQQRKLNFLITQTELYAHFMARKMTGDTEAKKQAILQKLDERALKKAQEVAGGTLLDVEADDYDVDEMKDLAMSNAHRAYEQHQSKQRAFDDSVRGKPSDTSFANPTISSEAERPQPVMFEGKLKGYQLKGMNWLVNLYNQGINGILADEMGLGKTVQSISLLAHLAENEGIWGPFLVVAPASTLHNWQQEVTRFVSKFKVVPYWGNTQDRKIMRKFWNQEHVNSREASFHMVITSYQLVIQDVKYFQRIRWQYMILDEAQALKSTSSVRWKILLGFNCRNRLLLTGTPIQNSMAELWALLHFIMPTLFDSHDEFNEWFSKDIESHVEKQSGIDENQLSRLHMILKPFMLRRVKRDVENELSDKIEILVYCPLTTRQRLLYQAVKNKISIEDLLQSASSNTSMAQSCTSSLMNLVMQFRKVCNHPELFERREIRSPFYMKLDQYHIPKVVYRGGTLEPTVPSRAHLLYNHLNIFSSVNIHQSLFHSKPHRKGAGIDSCFSFLRLIDMSVSELHETMSSGLLVRWLALYLWLKQASRIALESTWHSKNVQYCHLHKRNMLHVEPDLPMSAGSLSHSPLLRGCVFTSPTSNVYSLKDHIIHCMPETLGHRKMRHRRISGHGGPSTPKSPTKTPLSPSRARVGQHKGEHKHEEDTKEHIRTLPIHKHHPRPDRIFKCQPTDFPAFLYNNSPRLHVGSHEWFCVDRSAAWQQMKDQMCGTLVARNSLMCGTPELHAQYVYRKWWFFPSPPGGLIAVQPRHGFTGIDVPDKEILVTDAGKLYVLDTLLARLKSDGHRVLIYSQMTRMIDILEEYMWHRKHTYMRLDGSSKISDRRDMVADFQTRSDIFVFLLSTRAGGLGINLTAADTVIFYDSDWNPTVDQQAMDRAHRLGQTKQVTVYRLICKGTIEERILQRAKEKSEIQRMVISGGSFRPDSLKPKEVVSLLLDDDEMERKLRSKQTEKKVKEEVNKEKDRKRKREKYQEKLQKDGIAPRGPGRPKKKKPEEMNVTIPAPPPSVDDSLLSIESAPSPQSVFSISSFLAGGEDSSNDGLVIVDDAHSTFPPVVPTPPSNPPPNKGRTGRPRGRPRGSGVGRRPRGRGSLKKALAAAEIHAAEAGRSAAFAAYGYSFSGASPSAARGALTPSGTPSPSPSPVPAPRASPGFYTQRTKPS